MRDMRHVRGLGPSYVLKQNVLSLILLIMLTKLTNQKREAYKSKEGHLQIPHFVPLITWALVPQ